MSHRALMIADRFQEINNELLAVVESCSSEQWVLICPAEGWTVAAVVRHVAAAYPFQLELIRCFASGETIPQTHADWSAINESNARFADENANAARVETLELLSQNVSDVRDYIVGLSDEQLDHTRYFPLMKETRTTERMIERILVGHPEEHLESIRVALAMNQ